MSRVRPAVLDVAMTGVLNVCEGRREDKGDVKDAETEGDLKQSSRNSAIFALPGVIGETSDLESFLTCSVGVLGEAPRVEKEEIDSVVEIEPC